MTLAQYYWQVNMHWVVTGVGTADFPLVFWVTGADAAARQANAEAAANDQCKDMTATGMVCSILSSSQIGTR